MKPSTPFGLWPAALMLACLAAAPELAQAQQKEKAWEFLDGLRQRGYDDLALDYLDQAVASPRCPDDFRAVVDYEAGVTLVSGLQHVSTPQAQEQQLDRARDRFNKFLKEHPDHAKAAAAETQLANVLVERGRLKTRLADRATGSAADKAKLLEDARTFYAQARKVFEESERRIYERAKALEGVLDPSKDAQKIADRNQAHADLLQARLYLAGVEYEIGRTYAEDSKEYKENLAKAAEQYNKLYEKYESLGGGLYARMWEGRIYKDLGKTDEATKVLKEMLTLPDTAEAFRLLKNQSLVLLLETYLLPKVKNYQEAILRAEAWTNDARGGEESSAEGLAIHYLGGTAALAQAESLKANDPKRNDSLAAARRHFDFVARFPGEHQRDARAKLLGLSASSPQAEAPQPTNYVEAKDRGDFAWGTMVVAMGQADSTSDQQAQQQANQQRLDACNEAIRCYRDCLALKTREVSLDDLNMIRSRLAYLYWEAGDYYRAAVMGEFLARRYPESAGARKGAEIAVKAYRTLYVEAAKRSEDAPFEADRMNRIANYLTTLWPNEPEAQEAWLMLIDTAVDNRDLNGALAYLAKIAPDSPRRAEAELRTGLAMWAAYVAGAAKPQAERPPQAELDAMARQAQETLENGIRRMKAGVDAGDRPTYILAHSVLSLALIQISAGKSAEAVRWLDDPKIGPVTLLKADDPSVRGKDQFAEETYKAALRAYVGAEKLDEAEAAMAALEKLVAAGGDAEAGQRLTRIYIDLGRELEGQLTRLRSENKADDVKRVLQGFELFLNKISDRPEGNTFSSLSWVAETFFGLAAGMDPGGKEPPDEAKKYYRSATRTYRKILDQIKADPDFAPAGATVGIQVRLASCLRAIGQCDEAMQLLVSVLQEHPKRLDAQLEAARTYQRWGTQRPDYYEKAIVGGQQVGGRYLVWGWGGIARQVTPFYQKYEDTFHLARYNLARCRLDLALSRSAGQKIETLKLAKLDITRVYQLYPTMGGPEWFDKYDALLKTIQKLLQEKPTGLKAED